MWESLTVRSWQGVLYERQAAKGNGDIFADPGRDDHFLEAGYARRIHELRGIFMAQVAEIEDLLVELVDHIVSNRPDLLPPKAKRRSSIPVSQAVKIVSHAAMSFDHLSYLQDGFSMLRWAIARRNQLVHSRISIGYSQLNEMAPREPVLITLVEIRHGGRPIPWEDAPTIHGVPNPGDWNWLGDTEIGTYELESDISRLYKVLDAAVEIYEALSAELSPGASDPPQPESTCRP